METLRIRKRKIVPVYRPPQVKKYRLGFVQCVSRTKHNCAQYAGRGTSWENATWEKAKIEVYLEDLRQEEKMRS
jgi:hypothetical protein